MSDNWIAIIPKKMDTPISQEQLNKAADLFRSIAPDHEEIEIINQGKPRMFDCGTNLTEVQCPHCQASIDLEWWQEQAELGNEFDLDNLDDGEEFFNLVPIQLPCCGKKADLSQLKYTWDQGFSCRELMS